MKKGVGEKSIEALRVFSAHGELKVSEWILLSGMVGLSKEQRWAQERFIKRLWCRGLLARSYEYGSYGHRVYKLSDRGSELLRGVNKGSKCPPGRRLNFEGDDQARQTDNILSVSYCPLVSM